MFMLMLRANVIKYYQCLSLPIYNIHFRIRPSIMKAILNSERILFIIPHPTVPVPTFVNTTTTFQRFFIIILTALSQLGISKKQSN